MESSPDKEGEDGWGSGWGDEWGDSSKSTGSKSSPSEPDTAAEKWDSWSNEQPSPTAEPTTAAPDNAAWNNDWGSFTSSPATKATTKTAKSKSNQKRAGKTARTGLTEPATANLIDFGADESVKFGGDSGMESSGWDNEVWAAEEDDDWHPLEDTTTALNNERNAGQVGKKAE